MESLSKQDTDRLKEVHAGHSTSLGYTYHMPMHMAGLERAGLVQRNPEIKDGAKFAYRATDAGVAHINALPKEQDTTTMPSDTTAFPATAGGFPSTPATTVEAPVIPGVPVATTAAVAAAKRPRVTREALGEIKIDTHIPLPAAVARNTRGPGATNEVYPFSTLPVLGSFFLPNTDSKSLVPAVTSANRRHMPKTFTLREVTENDVKGVRIWRGTDLTPEQVEKVKADQAERSAKREQNKKAAPATAPAPATDAPPAA